jgi:hypothetical protein
MSKRTGEEWATTEEKTHVSSLLSDGCFSGIQALSVIVADYVWEFVLDVKGPEHNIFGPGLFVRIRLANEASHIPLHCEWFSDSRKLTAHDDLATHLDLSFALTGGGPEQMKIQRGDARVTAAQIYSWLSSIPIPSTFHLINKSVCYCNEGHCGALENLELITHVPNSQRPIRTSGDVFELWGKCMIWNEEFSSYRARDLEGEGDENNGQRKRKRVDDTVPPGWPSAYFTCPDDLELQIRPFTSMPTWIGCTTYLPAKKFAPSWALEPGHQYHWYIFWLVR